jgi:transposase
MNPLIRSLVSDAQAEIQDLVTRRRQLVEILTAEQNRLSGLRGNYSTGRGSPSRVDLLRE